MQHPRGKRFALGMLVIALVLIAAVLDASWDAFECGWQIRRLRDGDVGLLVKELEVVRG